MVLILYCAVSDDQSDTAAISAMHQEIPPSELATIEAELGKASALFGGVYPQIIVAACRNGYGSILGQHIEKAYFFDGQGIEDRRILETLLSMALINCDNQYCFIIHSWYLINLGENLQVVRQIQSDLKFPDSFDDAAKWTKVLQLAYYSHKDTTISSKSVEALKKILTDDEMRHYIAIMSLAHFLEFFITNFSEEVNILYESLFLEDTSKRLKPEIEEFIKFYDQEYKNPQQISEGHPVFVICSFCKDVRDKSDQWHKIEAVCTSLPLNAEFSHSICPTCFSDRILS